MVNDPASAAPPQPSERGRVSAVVEAEPVDERAVGHQPEHARSRIARLRLRRDGADLGEAAAHGEHGFGYARVLVETGGDAERVRQFEAGERDPERRIVGRERAPMQPALERAQRHLVRILGRKCEEQRSRESVEAGQHRAQRSSGSAGTPSGPSASGRTQSAAEVGSSA
jgi:hypothetical protein